MNEERAFLQAMLDDPNDSSLRMVFADWLEERGDPRGELLRLTQTLTQSITVANRPELEARLQRLLGEGVPPVGPYWASSTGMRFVWIPAGTFQMGSPLTEEGRKEGETLHQVTLSKGFFMGALLVCQEEWQAIMGDNPSQLKGEPQLPVDSVRFRECQDFCKKLWALDDKAYRLPTEAEWEYACRAGTTTAFHFGETITTAQVNYGGEEMQRKGSKALYQGKTTPVGRFPANAFGLHDMHGNLWEWCQDWYRVDVAAAATVDPQGPTTGNSRVLRGGSWVEPAEDCRSARRLRGGPNSRGGNCGFRLCFFPD